MNPAALGVKLLILPGQLICIVTFLLILCGYKIKDNHRTVIGALAVMLFVVRGVVLTLKGWVPGEDYRVYWTAGKLVLQGLDPYGYPEQFDLPMNSPPNSFPIMAIFASASFQTSLGVWVTVNSLFALFQVPLANAIIGASADGPRGSRVDRPTLLLITGLICLSIPVSLTIETGQLSLFVSTFLLVALLARKHGQMVIAGICLSLAALKPTSMIPFLIIFLNRRAWKTWAALSLATAALCLMGSPIDQFITRVKENAEIIRESNGAGGINDFIYLESNSDSRLGIDHALYRIGLKDRAAIRAVQGVLILAIGGYLLLEVLWYRRRSDAHLGAEVCIFSQLFVYHRLYDMVVLALPLVYITSRALPARGAAKACYIASAIAIIVALHPVGRLFKLIENRSYTWGVGGGLARGLILPSVTWALLIAFTALVIAEFLSRVAPGSADESNPIAA